MKRVVSDPEGLRVARVLDDSAYATDAAKYRIFTIKRPDGIPAVAEFLTSPMLECIVTVGVARTRCPCCDKKVVVREFGAAMTGEDADYLNAKEDEEPC